MSHRFADAGRVRGAAGTGRASLAFAAAILALLPASAAALDASAAEVAELAGAASAGDAVALTELRRVSSIDGRATDVGSALAGSSGSDLDARLEELADAATASEGGDVPDAAAARDAAEGILGGAREESAPSASDDPDGGVAGLDVPFWLAAAIALLAVALGAIAARAAARRTPVAAGVPEADAKAEETLEGYKQLEDAARRAEERGDYAAAVRLRFRAGLARLDHEGALRLHPSLTAAAAAREAGAPSLPPLATAYEGIAFGGRHASRGDSDAQREGWRRVVREVSAR